MTGAALPPPSWPLTTGENITKPWYGYIKDADEQLRDLSVISTFSLSVLDSTSAPVFYSSITTTPTTWTPELMVGGTTVGTSYATQVAYYSRQGNQVDAWGHIALSTHAGTTGGNPQIKGLPLASANIAGLRFSGSVGNYEGFPGPLVCRITTNSTIIGLFQATATSLASIPSSSVGVRAVVEFAVRYFTTQ